ncbi:MAG TPA: bifunctional demethylmenaquinone methyltransferase/2-methoxy-6-polyprenyl-1,4-benzoquinol methylase UbiE, partial [Pseudomonas sp.]|nr:bifunctional demethylmenaquinone methyltransferase/2-methoxy-6-polyprenyl-1,4-benzoquinol methylase UbiE [Pseudomonas sp.]
MTDPRKVHDAEPTTHFGYKSVPESQKAQKVAEVFHSVAAKYDLMNDLMSGGIHRLWKRFTIELSGARQGNRILDIAGGTGDLTRQFSRIVGPTGEVVLADINASMLKVGRDKLLDKGVAGNVKFVQADAEKLPFPDNHFDVVTIAFGLRNVTHKEDAIASMLRVLKPGGRLLVLEFSKPTNQLFSKAYDAYSFSLLPMMGKLITNDADSYRYLAESIRMHPDQE